MNSAFAFQKKANETLEQKALRICEIIVSTGVAIRGGNIVPGGCNVAASNNARAMSDAELKKLRDTKKEELILVADLIAARQAYIVSDSKYDLDTIAHKAVQLRSLGLLAGATPSNFDRNAVGAALMGCKAQEGVAKKFAEAFGIVNKIQADRKPSTLVKG